MRLPKLAAAIAFLLATSAFAQDTKSLIDLVPADSLFLLHWAGSTNTPAYANSKLLTLLTAMKLPEWWDTTLPTLLPEQARGTPQASAALDLAKALATYATENESILFSTGEGVTDDLKSEPQLSFILRFPTEATAREAEKNIQDLITGIVADNPIPNARFFRKGADLAVTFKDLTDRSPLEPPKLPITDSPTYRAAAHELGHPDAPVQGYFNFDKGLALAEQQHDGEPDFERNLKVLGLRSLHAVALHAWFDGADFSSHTFFALDPAADRHGLVGALATTRPSTDLTPAIPATALSVTTFTLDLPDLLDRIKREGDAVKPGFSRQADSVIALAAGALGLQLAEFLPNWGKDFALVTLPSAANDGTFNYLFISKPADADKAKAHLNNLAAGINRVLLMQKSPLAPLTFTPGDISTLSSPLLPAGVSLAWATTPRGYLLISLSPAAIDQALHATDPLNLAAIRARLEAPEEAAISWSNLPASAEPMYVAWSAFLARKASASPHWLSALPRPTLAQLKPLLAPSASATWVTDTGLHYRTLTPFPGAEALSPLWSLILRPPLPHP